MEHFNPGIYEGIPEVDYHSGVFGPRFSISSTDAKNILRAPAFFEYARHCPAPPNSAFDIGTVTHAKILGTPENIAVYPDEVLSTNGQATTRKARDFATNARELGLIPVKSADLVDVDDMVNAVKNHPIASQIFSEGTPEQSIYAQDAGTKTWMRGRVDWETTIDGETVLVDLKTTATNASLDDIERAVATYDYALQMEWYRAIWQAVAGEYPRFVHVFVSKKPPYLVNVVELDAEFQAIGRMQVREALDTWDAYQQGSIPAGYPEEIQLIAPPAYYANKYLEME
ncbi:PD-(D/E)XK nuclease-like domain-containing protein [Actinotignum urinale]|uniref:PD-(D/E)XK nuclease-like domain-containing protein n=1 Tax=Actinotignum urinale TaxID=190146 RepID=A0AAW9HVC7_9ACTO|nr:PD-(D/E)XK nuclease-like domain-containing protein [Actinotignum urinale]MDY5154305.1 PD-(D/E)XK nuclease-like domain-containing protein [Actinotignum urinale]